MKFKVISLGCKVNGYENHALSSLLINKGYTLAKKGEEVELAIINTCSVTHTADQKSRQQIRKLKKLYPNAIIVVMGCYAQARHEFIKNEIKPSIIVGTSNRDKIPELIEKYRQNPIIIDETSEIPRFFKYEELGVTSCSENIRAYLKIQDGCDNFCSYCLIPYLRGRSRSRRKIDVISEAKYLISKGYKEIVLTGIHVGGYGHDLTDCTFSDLVEELSNLDGLYRLRISSIEASEITPKLIELIKTKDNIAKHMHIPLQSGSETVLKRMNRKYSCKEFLDKLHTIKNEVKDIFLSTDVIVGFPGETDEEFIETYNFIKEVGFDSLHVFPFSSREGTAASKMKDQIHPDVKKERSAKLIELSKELLHAYTLKYIGSEQEVLIEEFDKENKVCIGHTSNFLHVKIDSDTNLVGKIIKKTIKKSDVIE